MNNIKVELVALTQPSKRLRNNGVQTAEDLIVYCARVSNPANQLNMETGDKLLRYCVKKGHWSVFEQADMTVEVKTSRAIAAQILRHKTFSFQEFCVSGDTEISFDLPSGDHYKIKIRDIYDRWHNGAKGIASRWNNDELMRIPQQNRLSKMNLRTYNEETGVIEYTNIKDVFYNGVKDVFEVTLKCGRSIKCTGSHKFLTQNGFHDLNNLTVGDLIAVNGVPLYQSEDWLMKAKDRSILSGRGIIQISEECNVSYHTIRKWLKKYNLQFSKKEVAQTHGVWNKGVTGYNTKPRSFASKAKQSINTPKGCKHHSWRGGSRYSERQLITDYISDNRQAIYDLYSGKAECNKCKKDNCKIILHHIEEIRKNPNRAYDITNIEPVCDSCHKKIHKELNKMPYILINLEDFNWPSVRPEKVQHKIDNGISPIQYTNFKRKLINFKKTKRKTVSWSQIESIVHIGQEEVYDIETVSGNHNYIANKIVVHNSQRYSEVQEFEPIELRLQGKTNRQVGDEIIDPELNNGLASNIIQIHIENSKLLYDELINSGVARECARMVLPLNVQTTLYMKGNIRSWIHYLQLRAEVDTQKEHRIIAEGIKEIFKEEFPIITELIFPS